MRVKAFRLLAVAAFLGFTACATADVSQFPIAGGPLQANDLALASFAHVNLGARSFDVVNQDLAAEQNTGLAGKVDPMPVDILSRYAAQKFTAVGGVYNSRFVIQQAQFQVRAVKTPDDDFLTSWFDGDNQAEMVATISVMLTASRPDGVSENVTVTTTQAKRLSFNTSPETRRAAYLELMNKALAVLDTELAKQIPVYYNDVAQP